MRSGLILLFFLHAVVSASGQRKDSVLLPEAVVIGIPEAIFLKGSTVHAMDSAVRRNFLSHHLGDALPAEFPIYFRSYGNGMLSTISLRGTSPEHTAVLWNGININNFSLGLTDFSNLLAGTSNSINVHAGGGSARFGSGAIGGTILLNSLEESPALNFVQEFGSFGKHFTSLQGSTDVGKFHLSSSGYWLQSENDFKVISTGERQPNASFLHWGFQQQVRYQWDNAHQFSLNYWYHDADKNIQPPSGNTSSTSEQQDRNHRLSVQYKSAGRNGIFSATGGFLRDLINYRNNKDVSGDLSIVRRWIAGVNYQLELPGHINTEFSGQWNHVIATIANYKNGGATEDRFDLAASFQKDFGQRLSVSMNFRQPYITGFDAPFLPYLGGEYKLIYNDGHILSLRGNVSRNYRAPTLNERYWEGAGDLNILPEVSIAAEAGFRWQWKEFVFDNTYFFQDVDQWIQWVEKASETFVPENIKRVRVNGFETRVHWKKSIGGLMLEPSVSYQYATSITVEAPEKEHTIGKQLIYSPKHIVAGNFQMKYQRYSAIATVQFNSTRFTDFANTDYLSLDPYALVNLSFARYWEINRHRFDLLFVIRNFLNEDYRLYAARAVPGRNYSIQLTYLLNHKYNEN